MEQLKNEQTEQQTQPAAAEERIGEEGGEVSLGKFKNTAALLSAYNSLQSEFTKRCQKVKDLEAQLTAVEKVAPPTQTEEDEQMHKNDVLKEYLQGVLSKKQSAIVMDGVGTGFKTPVSRPKTIAQASVLAQEIFSK